MQTKVTFIYDEQSQLWEVIVSGVTTELEALQVFNSVLITSRGAIPDVECNKATIILGDSNSYKISVGEL